MRDVTAKDLVNYLQIRILISQKLHFVLSLCKSNDNADSAVMFYVGGKSSKESLFFVRMTSG